MARIVVAELQRHGYTTYEEVQVWRGSDRADIVGTRGPVLVVVEVKASMSLRLLDQCVGWTDYAHLVIAAASTKRIGPAAFMMCRHSGVGFWYVGDTDVQEVISPRLRRVTLSQRLRDSLRDEQRSGEYARAGSMGGGYFTPFRGTAKALRDVVAKQPGIALRDALAEVKHHYASKASAMSALPALIRKGVVDGVRIDEDAKPLRVYPVESPAAPPHREGR